MTVWIDGQATTGISEPPSAQEADPDGQAEQGVVEEQPVPAVGQVTGVAGHLSGSLATLRYRPTLPNCTAA